MIFWNRETVWVMDHGADLSRGRLIPSCQCLDYAPAEKHVPVGHRGPDWYFCPHAPVA